MSTNKPWLCMAPPACRCTLQGSSLGWTPVPQGAHHCTETSQWGRTPPQPNPRASAADHLQHTAHTIRTQAATATHGSTAPAPVKRSLPRADWAGPHTHCTCRRGSKQSTRQPRQRASRAGSQPWAKPAENRTPAVHLLQPLCCPGSLPPHTHTRVSRMHTWDGGYHVGLGEHGWDDQAPRLPDVQLRRKVAVVLELVPAKAVPGLVGEHNASA